MKNLWLFPMILFILLLGAGALRWENGVIQVQDDLQVVHTRDNWTGQSWILLFGDFDDPQKEASRTPYPLYSGEWVPHLSKEKLDQQIELALSGAEWREKAEKIQTRIERMEVVKRTNQQDYDLYVEALAKNGAGRNDRELFAAYTAWEEADQELKIYMDELIALRKLVREDVLEEFKKTAMRCKLIMSAIWYGLLLVTLISTFHYFVAEVKRWKRVNETYEIVEYVTKNRRYN